MCNKPIYPLMLALVLGLLASGAWSQENQITNGEFDDGTTDWYRYGTEGYDIIVVQDAGLSGDNAVMLDIFDASATASIGLARAPFLCEQGQTYPFSFMARAEEERQMVVLIQLYKPEGPNWIDVFMEVIDLKRTPQLYTFQYEHTQASISENPNWEIAIYYMLKGAYWSMEGSDLNVKVWLDQFVFGAEPTPAVYEKARKPEPANGATDVPRDVAMNWVPGDYAVAHDVYLGMDFNDVNDAARDAPMDLLVSQDQVAAEYDPEGLLDFDTTYYWRIDEVNATPVNWVFEGNVWSFTTEPFAYPVQNVLATSNLASDEGRGPENAVNGSGIDELDQHSNDTDDMWIGDSEGLAEAPYVQFEFDKVYKLHEMLVWNYNFEYEVLLGIGAKDVTIEYSTDGAEWMSLGDAVLGQGPGTNTYLANSAVPFEGVAAQYVRLTINANYGTGAQYGLSEVRFMYLPVRARLPEPTDGATDVDVNPALSWRSGRQAASHQVYIGTDQQAVIDGTAPVQTLSQSRYAPGGLDLMATYYWRVDEVNDAENVTLWEGPVWSFTTQESLLVDGFESYNDDIEASTTVWQSWIDGIDHPATNGGSAVGHDTSPFAETSIVNSGWQSMPLYFNNTGGVTFSQTTHTFDTPQDWTAHGVKTLSLYVHGDPTNIGLGQLYVAIDGVKVLYDNAVPDVLTAEQWTPWSVDLAAIGTDLQNVTTVTIGIEGAGASGRIYVDTIQLMP